MPQSSPVVFLSHSGADTKAARELKRRLESAAAARAARARQPQMLAMQHQPPAEPDPTKKQAGGQGGP
jgi:hypothetical protein